jgi:hypothetical protein
MTTTFGIRRGESFVRLKRDDGRARRILGSNVVFLCSQNDARVVVC